MSGFDNIDGINLEYTKYFGDWTSRLNVVFGATDTTLPSQTGGDPIQITSQDFWDVTWNLNWNWLTLQANYSESTPTLYPLNDLINGLNQLIGGALSPEQIDLLTVNEDRAEYGGFGIAADWGTWLASAEYTTIKLNDSPISPDRKTWYVMGGFRVNKFTVALTYSEIDTPNNPEATALLNQIIPILDIIPGLAPDPGQAALAQAGIDQIVPGIEQTYYIGETNESYNLTVRYDFHPSAAFKFDYTETDREIERYGYTEKLKPSIVRMGVDLVF